jgi:hypothetical protein
VRTQKIATFILCGGKGSRWNQHADVPKQLAPVNGRPLIERTLQQIETLARNVKIVGPSGTFSSYGEVLDNVIGEDVLETIERLPYSRSDVSCVLLGDAVFSDAAIARLFGGADTRFFLHQNENIHTGKYYSEIFAFRVAPDDVDWMLGHLSRCRATPRLRVKIWSLLRSMSGTLARVENVVARALVETLDDFTDDIDRPRDYEAITRFFSRSFGQRIAFVLVRTWMRLLMLRRQLHNARRVRQGRPRTGLLIEDLDLLRSLPASGLGVNEAAG